MKRFRELLVLFLLISEAPGEMYKFDFSRDPGSNEITLKCRVVHNNACATQANFWLESQRLEFCRDQSCNCVFNITQALEGRFFCGTDSPDSNNKTLLAYISPNPETKTYYIVKVGDTVELDCGVGPGALGEFYSVQWNKGDDINEVNGPRYHTHASTTYSLTIEDTELSDGDVYRCFVGVDFPTTSNPSDSTVEKLIHLVVYEAPILSTKPLEVLVLEGGDQKDVMTFICSSGASGDSVMNWKHNGRIIKSGSRHAITTSSDGDHIESNLTISEIGADDSGIMECEILITADADPGIEEPGDRVTSFNASTSFTVLSDEFKLQAVDTVTGGQLKFFLTDLSPNIPEAVNFRIQFTSVTEGLTKTVLTNSDYMITKDTLCFEIGMSDVPFEGELITVQIAMMVNGITGPYVPTESGSAPELDLRAVEPESEDETPVAESTGAIIGYSIGGAVVTIVVVIIVLMTIRITSRRRHNRKMEAMANNKNLSEAERGAAVANIVPDSSQRPEQSTNEKVCTANSTV